MAKTEKKTEVEKGVEKAIAEDIGTSHLSEFEVVVILGVRKAGRTSEHQEGIVLNAYSPSNSQTRGTIKRTHKLNVMTARRLVEDLNKAIKVFEGE